MRVPRRPGILSVLLVVAACGASDATATPEPSLAAAGGDRVSASGGGVVDLTSAGAGYAQSEFSASRHAGGKVTGHFRQVRDVGGLTVEFHGEVTCLAVDPLRRRAWVGGIITKNGSTHPAFQTPIHQPGRDVWFRVVDYGEGANAPQPDRSTVYGFAGSAGIPTTPAYCEARPWPDADARTFPLSAGNIQVRP